MSALPGEPGSKMDQQFCNDVSRIADALEALVDIASTTIRKDLIERVKDRIFDDKASGGRPVR